MPSSPSPVLQACASTIVPARPEVVWSIITDLDNIGRLSPENTSSVWLPGHSLAVGARFRGRNRLGMLRWTTSATVTELVPGERFAFDAAGTVWTYRLSRAPGGTLVEESVRRDEPIPAPVRVLQRLAGVTDRQEHLRAGIESTLANLRAFATSPSARAA